MSDKNKLFNHWGNLKKKKKQISSPHSKSTGCVALGSHIILKSSNDSHTHPFTRALAETMDKVSHHGQGYEMERGWKRPHHLPSFWSSPPIILLRALYLYLLSPATYGKWSSLVIINVVSLWWFAFLKKSGNTKKLLVFLKTEENVSQHNGTKFRQAGMRDDRRTAGPAPSCWGPVQVPHVHIYS